MALWAPITLPLYRSSSGRLDTETVIGRWNYNFPGSLFYCWCLPPSLKDRGAVGKGWLWLSRKEAKERKVKSVEFAEKDDSLTRLQLPYYFQGYIFRHSNSRLFPFIFLKRCNQRYFLQNILSIITLIYAFILISHNINTVRPIFGRVWSADNTRKLCVHWKTIPGVYVGFHHSTYIYFN